MDENKDSPVHARQQSKRRHLLQSTQSMVRDAIEKLSYDPALYELVREPLRLLTVRFPVRMDNGAVKVLTGYRVQHNDARGPMKGGIRFYKDVDIEEMKALAIWMSVRCGVANLPFGGSQGAIVCDPREMSFSELERASRGYVRAISQVVGPAKDIPSPDMHSNSQNVAWMFDEYSQMREFDSPNFITGKPLVLGGVRGRERATAYGAAICTKEAANLAGLRLIDARVAIQGFGSIGSYLAKFLYDAGAKIVAISDAYGALYDATGLAVDDLLERRDSFGTVSKLFKNVLPSEAVLGVDCDVLILATTDNELADDAAGGIRASVVIEAVNGAISNTAAQNFSDKNVFFVPDILTNTGNVVVSYFEWIQNNQAVKWPEDEVTGKLANILQRSLDEVANTSQVYHVDMRMAAYMAGIRRAVESALWRGWI